MAKQAAHGDRTKSGESAAGTRKLEKARAAQQKAAHKLDKLRALLATAEAKLAKRTERVNALQGQREPARDGTHVAPAPKRRAKARATEHDRLTTLGMVDVATSLQETDAMPIAAPDGTGASAAEEAPEADDDPPTRAHGSNSGAHGATGHDAPTV